MRIGKYEVYDLEPVKFVPNKNARELAELFCKLEGDKVFPPRLEILNVEGEKKVGYLILHKLAKTIGTFREKKVIQRGTFIEYVSENESMLYRVWVIIFCY